MNEQQKNLLSVLRGYLYATYLWREAADRHVRASLGPMGEGGLSERALNDLLNAEKDEFLKLHPHLETWLP